MKYALVLALAAMLSIPAVCAEREDLGGKWVAWEAPDTTPMRSNASCVRTPNAWNNPSPLGGQTQPSPAELELTMDSASDTVTGSILLPSFQQYGECGSVTVSGCGRMKIAEGRTNGRDVTFTTYTKVNGSRIPTRWSGEVLPNNAISLRALDTLPCRVPPRLASTGAGLFRSGVAGDLVYRRGEDPQDRKGNNPPTGATGKWWTNDRGQVTALDIKVNNKGKVTGSVSFCGGPEQKIEKGSLVGKSIVFETPGNMGSLLSGLTINVNPRANNGRTQVWNGELVNDDTLTLSSSNSLLCQLPSAVSLMFVRQGSKDRKYVA